MIEIGFLVNNPETIPTLTDWFRDQWPAYYAGRLPEDIANDFHAEANRATLPVRLVAFVDGALAGTIALRRHAIRTAPEYQPGLGGLLVAEAYRRRGIGTELVRAGMALARELGFCGVYTTTTTAEGILARLGWHHLQTLTHEDELLQLYHCDLGK